MRLHVLSDLHLEFGGFSLPEVEADVLVLAGDIALRTQSVEWAKVAADGRPTVLVPGNHEYYGDSLPRLTHKLREAGAPHNIHVLERSAVVLDGVAFFGATLWSDFELLSDSHAAMQDSRALVTDYRRIRVSGSYRKLRPEDTASIHASTRRWLNEQVRSGATRGAVVVTHHAPSARSVAPALLTDRVSPGYASNLDSLVEDSGAMLWVHGHTHYCSDYQIGRTRVLSNPRGYADEPVAGFQPNLVVEVSNANVT